MIAGRLLACMLAVSALAFSAAAQRTPATAPGVVEIPLAQLPREAHDTLAVIRKKGPYPYARDGAVFGNREKLLPLQARGYYREFTVKTPGERTRGARRIVVGKGGEVYYTDDHYNHFRRIRE